MRVMYVIPAMVVGGGAEALLETQLPFLIKRGIEPIVVTVSSRQEWREAPQTSVKCLSLDVGAASGQLGALKHGVMTTIRLRRLIRELQPDLVHLHLFGSNCWGRLSTLGLVPSVTTWHNTDLWMTSRALKNRFRLWLDRTTAGARRAWFIAVSRAVRDWSCEYLKVPYDRTKIIINGIVLSSFVTDMPKRTNNPPRIVMVGRLRPQKGYDIAIRALARLRDAGAEFVADFFGEGHLKEQMKALTEELGLSRQVSFRGVSRELPRILPDYDLFIMPSRHEGLGIAAVEAMASFLPVIGTNVAGLSEVIEHEKTGLLIPSEDPEELAKAIERLLRDKDLRERFARAGRVRIEVHFNLDDLVTEMVEYYQAICDER